MRKIPKKNYMIVSIICIFTIVFVSYFVFWYTETSEYNANNSIMTGYLMEIGEEELIVNLNNYVVDNPNTILYMSYGNDSTVKDFESEFKRFINDNNIKTSFVYIDLNRVDDKNFTQEFKDNLFSEDLKNKNFSIIKQPNLFIFKSGKVESALYYTKQSINMKDVEVYLENEEVIEND